MTLVEFALVAAPFFLLLFGTFEIGFIFWGTYELENATEDAARKIRTGEVQLGNVDQAGFKALVCQRVSVLFDCDTKLQVDVRSYNNFSEISGDKPDPLDAGGNLSTNFTFNPGGPRAIILVSSFYEWPLINPASAASLSNMASGNRLLQASVAFRNEAWPAN